MGSDFSVSVSDKEVYVGQEVTFKCEVNKRSATAEWKKGDRKLSGGNKYKMSDERNSDGSIFYLTIHDVQLEDNGEYTIHLTHKQGEANGAAILTVKERLQIVKPIRDVTLRGGERIELKCEVNKDGATVKWLKNNKQVSENINVTMTQNGKEFILTIKQAQRSDHGTYTCEVTLCGEKATCSADITVQEFEKEWRTVSWDINSKNKMIKEISSLKPKVTPIRILLHGPVGAGKSSFVNSIDTVFTGHISSKALADAGTGKSFTRTYKTHRFQMSGHPAFLPFVVSDIMGLEGKDSDGANTDDVINALHGHLKDNHELKEGKPLSKGDSGYNSSPSLADEAHCLVSVIPADKIILIDEAVIMKMRQIREKASKMGIPQVVVMTMLDKACPLVEKDLRKIYTSLKIKEKMEECHYRLGVPMNCIFPLKNYHEEGSLVLEQDYLILTALTQIIHLANDYLSTINEQ